MDIYRDIAAGSAQVNAMSDFLQEDEKSMKTGSPIFNGRGISRDVHVQYPFSCEPRVRGQNESDFGCDVTLPKGSEMLEAEDPIQGFIPKDLYDYTKPVNYDYSSQRTNELLNSK